MMWRVQRRGAVDCCLLHVHILTPLELERMHFTNVKWRVQFLFYDGEAFSLRTREKNDGIANNGFGASNERYSWSQTIHDVTLIIPVPSSTKGKNVDCCIEPNHLRVGLRGTTPVLDVPAVFLHHR